MILDCEMAIVTNIPAGMQVDWQEIIMILRRAGISFGKISQETGIPECRIKGWFLQGYEPRHIDGNTFIRFYWNKVAKKNQLPLKKTELSAGKILKLNS